MQVSGKPESIKTDEIGQIIRLKPKKLLGGEYQLRPSVKEVVSDYLDKKSYPMGLINEIK